MQKNNKNDVFEAEIIADNEREHHEFSPSSLARFELCPGSYKLSHGLKSTTSTDATRGTALHAMVETGKIADEIPEEDKAQVQAAINYRNSLAPESEWQSEQKVSILDGFETLCYGYMDDYAVIDDKIIAIDYKFGRNPVVLADNIQVEAYSLGLMQKFGKPVEFHIVQPPLNSYNDRTIAMSEMPIILNRIKSIINKCKSDTIILTPSIKACQYCKAINTCPASKGLVESSELAKIEHCSELATEKLGEYLDKAKVIEKIIASLKNQVRERLVVGEDIPGWKLSTRKGSITIKDINKAIEIISEHLNMEQWLQCVSMKFTAIQETYARHRKETDGITLKQAKEEILELLAPVLERSPDSKVLTKDNKKKELN